MNSLVNNEKQSHCIYHTTHTHTSEKSNKTHKKQHSHSRCNCVRKKNITEQPELHQLTTKQQRKILSTGNNKITQQ